MIQFLVDNLVHVIVLLVLLVGSAYSSASETALFSLSRHQLQVMRTSANPFLRLAAVLMRRPDDTLVTILLSNMTVNVSFFATASVLVLRTAGDLAGWQSTLVGFLPLLVLIFFGEVLPKLASITYPRLVAGVVAGPLYAFSRAVWPLRVVLQRFFVTPGVRLLTPPEEASQPVSADDLQQMLAHSASRGLLAHDEGILLQEVIELRSIRVREIAVPRVDMVTFDLIDSRETFLDQVRRTGRRRIPVHDADPDNLVGILHARDVLLHPDRPLNSLLRPVWYVPEIKTVDSLLHDFHRTGERIALCVDEYGAVTGLVALEDVIEEIIGEIFDFDGAPDDIVRPVGDDAYVLSGRLSIREWAQTFRQPMADFDVNTIGGLITKRLGRLARVGDTLLVRNLRFTVTRLHGHRIVEVRLERLPEVPDRAEGHAS